ncbi:TPA: hypothetical protein ACH9J7_004400, partial [Escherichia coli]
LSDTGCLEIQGASLLTAGSDSRSALNCGYNICRSDSSLDLTSENNGVLTNAGGGSRLISIVFTIEF